MTVLTSQKSPAIFSDYLKNKLLLPDNPDTDSRISFHTDISLFSFGDTVICAPFLYGFLSESLPHTAVIAGERPFSPYPHDVLYNAALVGKTLFCNVKYTSSAVISEAEKRGIKTVNVKQGYAKCCTVPVTGNALITCDVSIKKAAEKEGMDVLSVSNTGVLLDGFESGFIGGASLCLDHKIVFTGDIFNSPDSQRIIDFIGLHGKTVSYFRNYPLMDIGSPAVVS